MLGNEKIYDFLPLPLILQKIEYAENCAKQTCVANIDEQLWFHKIIVNVKFEGSKARKSSKKHHFYDLCKFDTRSTTCAARASKLQVDIFWKLGIIIYHH